MEQKGFAYLPCRGVGRHLVFYFLDIFFDHFVHHGIFVLRKVFRLAFTLMPIQMNGFVPNIQDELRLFAFAEEPVKPFFFSVKMPAHAVPVLIPAGVYNIRPGFFQGVIKLIIAFD